MTAAFGTRSFGVNGIAPRSLGKPTASYPGSIATDVDLAIGVDRLQTRLAIPLDSVSGTMTVESALGIVAGVLLTIDSEIVQVTGAPSGSAVPIARGFDGTAAAIHLASAAVSGFIDAYHHNTLASEIQAIEQALGPNLSSIPTSASINNSNYDFAAQSPGGSLTVGANTITLSPMPVGLAIDNYLYISGGTGAAEAVKLLGVSAGSIVVSCANAHTGAWTIRSATTGVQEAMVVARNSGALATVMISKYATFYAVANVPATASWLTISLRGQGKGTISIQRDPSYRTGPLLFYNGTSAANQIGFELHDLEIADGGSDHSWFPNAGSSCVRIKDALACHRLIDNVSILNSNIGIDLEGCFGVTIHNVMISWGPNPNVKPSAGIFVHSVNAILGNPGSAITLSDVQILQTPESTNGNQAQAGIVFSAVDGCQISNSSIIQTDYGIMFSSFGPTDQIDGVFLDTILIDANKANNIVFTGGGPAFVGDIAIRNCSMSMWARNDAPPITLNHGIAIDPSSRILSLEITNNLITTAGLAGIYVAGKNIKRLIIAGNRITDCNARSQGFSAIEILPGATNVLIEGNTIGNTGAFVGVMAYGVRIDGSAGTNNLTIVGNDLRGNAAGPLSIVNGVPASLVIANNGGLEDVVPAVNSAASIAAPPNPVFQVTGTTTVTTMTGGWMGARKTLIKTDAGSLTVGGGGNIPGVHTLAQHQSITLVWNGTAWY